MWIVLWDPFLMKKLLKSEICGSVNSTRCVLIGWKKFEKSTLRLLFIEQCMSSRNLKNAWKKKKGKTQTNVSILAESKRSFRTNLELRFTIFQLHLCEKGYNCVYRPIYEIFFKNICPKAPFGKHGFRGYLEISHELNITRL